MGRIESTIGKSQFQVPAQKRFVVEDEGAQPVQNVQPVQRANRPERPGLGREINPTVAAGLRRQAQEQMQETEQRSLHDARRRVELITGLGRKTKDVRVDGMTFTLRTLKAFEQNLLSHIVDEAKSFELGNGKRGFTPASMYTIKIEALSHSLYAIDNQPVDIVLGTINLSYEDQVLAKKDLITEMDNALVDHLFLQYEQLSQEVYDGYAPKNAKEAEEAVEAIRKSGENA